MKGFNTQNNADEQLADQQTPLARQLTFLFMAGQGLSGETAVSLPIQAAPVSLTFTVGRISEFAGEG